MAWAIGISLAAHLACYGTYELGVQTGLWDKIPGWFKQFKILAALFQEKKNPPEVEREVPLVFVDVNPAACRSEF